jgi:uncharacterized protein (DUF433 family)
MDTRQYQYLKPKRGSRYRQLFVNGRIMAEILYRQTVGPEPLTPDQVAQDYGLPLAAVEEAIEYCQQNAQILEEDRRREAALIQQDRRDQWPYAPRETQPDA